MTPLARRIADEIAAGGPVTVARFMEIALADPEHGYYATRDPLGEKGDFITAPEVSQMFGELMGLWAAVAWEHLGRPDPVILAELGPGRGTLMADALRAARLQPGFVEAAHLHLIETSPALRRCQAEALSAYGPAWHDRVNGLPDGPAIILANEFFDALPVRQFVRRGGGWAERRVARGNDGGFCFTTSALPPDVELPACLPDNAEEDAIAEATPAARRIAGDIGARLAAQGGAALVVDYGYSGPAAGDTLQAVRGHEFADPLSDPGEADLTAHVDFTALARAARAGGGGAQGPVSQGQFLLALGIAQRAERLAQGKDDATRRAVESALRRLIAPSEMGNLFKAMALTQPGLSPLPGFGPA